MNEPRRDLLSGVKILLRGVIATGFIVGTKAAGQLVDDVNALVALPGIVTSDPGTTLALSIAGFPDSASVDERNFTSTGEGFEVNRNDLAFSSDGGTSPRQFQNQETFDISFNLLLQAGSSAPSKEAGIRVGAEFDGIFYVNTATGEITALGSVLPSYFFTLEQGLTYSAGDPILMRLRYAPPVLNEGMVETAGVVEYIVDLGNGPATSGPLSFFNDEGGIINDSAIAVYEQASGNPEDSSDFVTAMFSDFDFNGPLPNPNADFDDNSLVDGADAIAWQRGVGIVATALPADGDADFDLDVDAADLRSLVVQFGTSRTNEIFAASEPSSGPLVTAAILVGATAFRQRGRTFAGC